MDFGRLGQSGRFLIIDEHVGGVNLKKEYNWYWRSANLGDYS